MITCIYVFLAFGPGTDFFKMHNEMHSGLRDMHSTFRDMESVFDDFFSDPFFNGESPGARANGRAKKKVIGKEHKKKSDPVEDMYNWKKPMFNKNKRSHIDEDDYDFSYESDGKYIS